MDAHRLNTAAMLILAAASDRPVHGYAIGKEIERRMAGELRLGATSLYRTIKQLLDAGYLQDATPRPLPDPDDERRRYFRTTAAGRRALDAEARRLRRVLDATAGSPSRGRA
jgi:DNA-binding PadR family transcriptional regulator